MNKFNQETTPPVMKGASYADRQFLHTFLAGLLLPLAQASIIAAMSMVGTAVTLYLFDAVDYVKPVLVMGVLTWIFTFLYLMRRWLNLTSLEQITGLDINGDGQIGKVPRSGKAAEPLLIRLDEFGANGHYRSRTMALDVSQDQLRALAQGLLNGLPFTERQWTGPGKPFSSGPEGSFRPLRRAWLKEGILQVVSDKDHRQGFDFTDEGWAMLEKLAAPLSDPPAAKAASPQMPFGNLGGEAVDGDPLSDEEWKAIQEEQERYQS
jgi:hypothetical protein